MAGGLRAAPFVLWGFIRAGSHLRRTIVVLPDLSSFKLLSRYQASHSLIRHRLQHFRIAESAATLETLRKHHVLVPADDAALCAPVLDSVFLGVQRQFPQELAGLLDPVPYRRLAGGSPDHVRSRCLHR